LRSGILVYNEEDSEMRTRIVLALVILFTLLLTSCALTEEGLISIAKDLEDAINAEDIEAVMALLTDDVVVDAPLGRFEGKDEAREFFEGLIWVAVEVNFSNFQKEGSYLKLYARATYQDGSSGGDTLRYGFEGRKINYHGP
jgi:hypothetical protein